MKSKKINKIVICMGVLACISGGLFFYQNFYLGKKNEESIIYVAKNDIPAMSQLKNDMFTPVSIPKSSVLPGFVTNLDSIVGKELRGGILKDEPLNKSRVISSDLNKFDLEIKLESDISVAITDNEYVNVYVILKDSQGKVEIENIFEARQVKVNTVGVSVKEDAETFYTINVTDKELNNYYDAKERGKIIIAKNNSLDAKQDITDKKYNPDSDTAKASVKPSNEDKNAVSIVEKKIEEGETLETLAIKYKTTVPNIKNLNNGKEDFIVGDNIVLPAN